MRNPKCSNRYSVPLLSFFIDRELHVESGVASHVASCLSCRAWIDETKKREQQIHLYEKQRENFVIIESFDVQRQKRLAKRLAWQPVLFGFNSDGQFIETETDSCHIKFYLKYFWYGQVGIYLANKDLGADVLLQRGLRYIQIRSGNAKRIIAKDGIMISIKGQTVIKITLSIPSFLKEKSITHKYKSLALGTSSFIARFFSDRANSSSESTVWSQVRKTLSTRDVGIFLMHLNTDTSYKKIAHCFQVSPHYVAKLIARVRHKMFCLVRKHA